MDMGVQCAKHKRIVYAIVACIMWMQRAIIIIIIMSGIQTQKLLLLWCSLVQQIDFLCYFFIHVLM